MVANRKFNQDPRNNLLELSAGNGFDKLGHNCGKLFPTDLAPFITHPDITSKSNFVEHIFIIKIVVHGDSLDAVGGTCRKTDGDHAEIFVPWSTGDHTNATIGPQEGGRRVEFASPYDEIQITTHQQTLVGDRIPSFL